MVIGIKKNRNKKRNRNKNKIKTISLFFSILIVFLILSIIGFLIFTNINITDRRVELKERADVLRKAIQTLEQKNQELEAKIDRAEKSDFLEEKARKEFGLKRPGEEVVVILPIGTEEVKRIEETKTFWQKIKNWLKL